MSIETWLGHGTGVVVDPEGLVLTAAHVVPDDEAHVRFEDAPELHRARVVHRDQVQDVALLRVDTAPRVSCPLPAASTTPDQVVLAFGRDESGRLHWTAGRVFVPRISLPIHFAEPREGDGRYFRDAVLHTAPRVPGDSGGPVVDLQGRLVGIDVLANPGELTLAVPATSEPRPPPAVEEAVDLAIEGLLQAAVQRNPAGADRYAEIARGVRDEALRRPPHEAVRWAYAEFLRRLRQTV